MFKVFRALKKSNHPKIHIYSDEHAGLLDLYEFINKQYQATSGNEYWSGALDTIMKIKKLLKI